MFLVGIFLGSIPFAIVPQVSRHSMGARPPWELDSGANVPTEGIDVDCSGEWASVSWVETGANSVAVQWSGSIDSGITWSPPLRLDGDSSGANKTIHSSSVLVFGSAIHVFWLDDRSGRSQFGYRRSLDGGASWQVEQILDPGAGRSILEFEGRLSEDGASLFLLASVSSGLSPAGLLLFRSGDGGVSWNSSDLMSGALPNSLDCFVEQPHFFLSWTDDRLVPGSPDVYFRASLDFGLSFAPEVQLNASASGSSAANGVTLDFSGTDVAVAWTDLRIGNKQEAFLAYSTDFGSSFSGDAQVSNTGFSTTGASAPCLRLWKGVLYLSWWDDRYVTPGVFLAKSFDQGNGWSEQFVGYGKNPNLLCDLETDYFACLWGDIVGPLASVSRDNGITMTGPVLLNPNNFSNVSSLAGAFDPQNRNFICAWIQDTNGVPRPYAGGLRGAHVVPIGLPIPGGSFLFAVDGFPVSEANWRFQIIASSSTGMTALPKQDGRYLGLAFDNLYRASPKFSPFAGQLTPAAAGSTPSFTIPSGILSGTVIWFAVVSWRLGASGPEIGTASDGLAVTFL